MDKSQRRIARRYVLTHLAVSLMGIGVPTVAAHAATPKPIVVVFAVGAGEGPSIEVRKGDDDPTRAQRTLAAARSVRDMLTDSGAVAATLYNAEAPLFKRAAAEAKIQLLRPEEPTDTEQAAISKGVGATYRVCITARPTTTPANGIEILLTGEGPDKKPYSDKTTTGGSTAENNLRSAANTLVTRLLNGPLAEYGRSAAPPALLPPPVTPPTENASLFPPPPTSPPPATATKPPVTLSTDATKLAGSATATAPPATVDTAATVDAPVNRAEATEAARRQAETLLTAGDNNAAIVLLRHAISQDPMASSLRIVLTRAYIAAQRGTEAAGEARRALTLLAKTDPAATGELTRLLTQAFALTGDTAAARSTYEQVVTTQPDAHWARIALANLLSDENRKPEAEVLLREVRQADPANREAALALARLLADRNDYPAAQKELAAFAAGASDSMAAYTATVSFFDERILRLGSVVAANRASWEQKTLSRDALKTAASAQTGRVAGLQTILKAAAPPSGSPAAVVKGYKKRVSATELLAQSITELISFLDTNEEDVGATASLHLIEFQREMEEARKADGTATP